MAEGDIGAVIASLEFDAGFALYPKILHVDGLIYAVAYTGPDYDGWIKTVSISNDGATITATGYSLEFEAGNAYDVDFIRISESVYAVAYKAAANQGIIKTVSISAEGVISVGGMDTFEFEVQINSNPRLIHVSGFVYAVAYTETNYSGWIKTVSISDIGVIGDPVLDSLLFEAGQAWECCIVHCTGDVYAVSYRDADVDGKIATVDIDELGNISLTGMSTLVFDATCGDDVRMMHVSGFIYAVVYKGPSDHGWIRTVSISADGATITATGYSLEFDAGSCVKPDIIHVSGDVYAVAYTGVLTDGWIKTVSISNDGEITGVDITGLEFDEEQGSFPHIIYIAGNIYAVVYGNVASHGDLVTLDIETVTPSRAKHLMIIGIG